MLPINLPNAALVSTPSPPTLAALPVAIIGAGPIGLAAAVRLLERGIEPVILEAGAAPGAAVRDWGHVPMFSTWRFNIDGAAKDLLERYGWKAPDPDTFPTGRDLADDYIDPLASLPEIASRLHLNARVTGVARSGIGKVQTPERATAPFEVRFTDADGQERRLHARAVIDAAGTWSAPNPAGAGGLPALGERAAADRIRYGMPDVLGTERARYAGRRVLVVGCGHSAVGTLIDLATLASSPLGTRIHWAHRRRDLAAVFGGGAKDELPERSAVGRKLKTMVDSGAFEAHAPFLIDAIEREPDGSLRVIGALGGSPHTIAVDEIIVATGLRPDLGYLSELRLDLDPMLDCPRALAPLIDPNEHSCGTVPAHGAVELAQPEPGLFLVGMKSYGRAPTFLLATGYEQVRSVAAWLAGDVEAARRVDLALPDTGVCSGPAAQDPAPASCCAPTCCEKAA
ncbi:MAG: flavoprotein [Alphaproteobacteria bacterium]|nr:flavoprotein [Alphaproteobacteria bacterium]